MRDGAPGEDGVRISLIRAADTKTKAIVAELTQELFEAPPFDWDSLINCGAVIRLHKKGPSDDLNYYRGVCLLSLASRILARV